MESPGASHTTSDAANREHAVVTRSGDTARCASRGLRARLLVAAPAVVRLHKRVLLGTGAHQLRESRHKTLHTDKQDAGTVQVKRGDSAVGTRGDGPGADRAGPEHQPPLLQTQDDSTHLDPDPGHLHELARHQSCTPKKRRAMHHAAQGDGQAATAGQGHAGSPHTPWGRPTNRPPKTAPPCTCSPSPRHTTPRVPQPASTFAALSADGN